MAIKSNDKTLTVAQYAAQFNKGQGKTTGATSGKGIDLINTNIPEVIENLPSEFAKFALSSYIWKENNYGNLEGEALEYIENCYIGRNHYNSASGEQKPVVFESPKKVLTAEEYRTGNIELNIKELSYQDIKPLLDIDGNDAKITKAQLLEVIHNLQAKIWTSDKEEIYQVMLEKEEAAKAKYKALYDAGFTDIIEVKGQYFANIELAKAPSAIPALASNNFELIDSTTNLSTMSLKVIFKDSQVTEKTDI